MDQIYILLNTTLNHLIDFTGDYGLAIIVLTMLIKTALLPLTWKQKKALQKQQFIQTEMAELKKKFAHDKTRLNQEMVAIMRKHGTGLAVFLPLLVQLPLFYLLYKLFSSTVVAAGSVISPWLKTLCMPDPYFIMPLLVVIAQLLPQLLTAAGLLKKRNPTPVNRSMLYISAIAGFFFMFQAPAALGIYWFCSAIYSAAEEIWFGLMYKKHPAI